MKYTIAFGHISPTELHKLIEFLTLHKYDFSPLPNNGKPIVSGSLPLCCMDCQRRYDAFGLDVVLPNEQWKLIHPDEQGVLCAQCIVNRADKMGAIVALMTIDWRQ